jgi:hypothetical protein
MEKLPTVNLKITNVNIIRATREKTISSLSIMTCTEL